MKLIQGDCLEALRAMPDASVDSVVTDPPYGLSFMGKKWDYDVPSQEIWAECLRVLKPGGHLLAFAGTRTQHRMAVRIEDAGFEIRDTIAWVYGSGFPKSHNLDGAWQGWGTALKPALEPITVARKPLIGTVAANVEAHGVGALNIDGCRVAGGEQPKACRAPGWDSVNKANASAGYRPGEYQQGCAEYSPSSLGRWPANLIHDGSDEVVESFPTNAGAAAPVKRGFDGKSNGIYGDFAQKGDDGKTFRGDTGSAARFFYCAKASKADRDEGCEMFSEVRRTDGRKTEHHVPSLRTTARKNHHPTVKPTALMRYLCRLVTPAGGTVLDPFMGSGSAGKAAALEGFDFIGIEREAEYMEIAKARIAAAEVAAKEEAEARAKSPVQPELFAA